MIRIRPYTDIHEHTDTNTQKYTLRTGSHSFDTAQPLPPFLTRDERHDDDEDRQQSNAVLRDHSGTSKLQRSAHLLLGRRGARRPRGCVGGRGRRAALLLVGRRLGWRLKNGRFRISEHRIGKGGASWRGARRAGAEGWDAVCSAAWTARGVRAASAVDPGDAARHGVTY